MSDSTDKCYEEIKTKGQSMKEAAVWGGGQEILSAEATLKQRREGREVSGRCLEEQRPGGSMPEVEGKSDGVGDVFQWNRAISFIAAHYFRSRS